MNRKTLILAVLLPALSWAQTPMTEQPQGTLLQNMEWSSEGYVPDYTTGQISKFKEGGAIATVVRNGNDYYIKNPFSHYPTQTWIHGELTQDGQQVVFNTPQALTVEQGVTFYATRLVRKGTGVGLGDDTRLIFDLRGDSLVQSDGGFLSITDIQGRTTSYLEYNIVIAPLAVEAVTPPDDAVITPYTVTFSTDSQPAQVAFAGNDVYVNCPLRNEAWMRGTISGNQISFPVDQFMGADFNINRYVYLEAGEGTTEYVEIPGFGTFPMSNYKLLNVDALVFNYDPDTRSFSYDKVLVITTDKKKLTDGYYSTYEQPAYTPFAEIAATPADPVIASFYPNPVAEGFNFGLFSINMPATDTEGNTLNKDKMYYNVYMDNTILQSPAGDTDIPYLYTDGNLIRVGGDAHTFLFYGDIRERIGAQVFYTGGGETRHSQLVWYNVNQSGIATTSADRQVERIVYRDVLGCVADTPQAGLSIQETIYTDGTREVRKLIRR